MLATSVKSTRHDAVANGANQYRAYFSKWGAPQVFVGLPGVDLPGTALAEAFVPAAAGSIATERSSPGGSPSLAAPEGNVTA
jgi:hypothetical protein